MKYECIDVAAIWVKNRWQETESLMKRTLALAVALATTLLAIPVTQALPPNEVDHYYWDAGWNQVGEDDLFCDGTHYTWGITSGAPHRTTQTSSCNTQSSGWDCSYWDSGCDCYVHTDLNACGL